jgi:hypothetical protein
LTAPITSSTVATQEATPTGAETSPGAMMMATWRIRFAAPNTTP